MIGRTQHRDFLNYVSFCAVKRLRFIIALLTLAFISPAFAQATLARSIPADGSAVMAPSQVWLIFSTQVMLASLTLESGDRRELPTGEIPDSFRATFVVDLAQEMSPGEYVVTWRAVDRQSRFSNGEFMFSVTE